MNRKVVIASMLLLLGGVGASMAQNQLAACRPPDDPDRVDFTIDASKKGSSVGARKYRVTDEVRIVVINKNPFLYDYDLKIQAVEVAEPALDRFLQQFAFIDAPDTEGQVTGSSTVTPTAACISEIQALQSEADRITGESETLREKTEAAKQLFSDSLRIFTEVGTQISSSLETIKKGDADCEELTAAVTKLLSANQRAEDEIKIPPIVQALTDAEARAINLKFEANRYKTRLSPECREAGTVNFGRWNDRAELTERVVAELRKNLNAMTTEIQKQKNQAVEVRNKALQKEAFYETQTVGPFEDRHDVTIDLKRKLIGTQQNAEDVFGDTLNFGGGPRFTLTAGIAFANLDSRSFEAIKGHPRASADSDPDLSRTASIVGLDEDSEWRATPLMMLHGRFKEWPNWSTGAHFSFGLSAKVEDGDTEVEYLTGVSLSFARRLFLTLGLYYGSVTDLEGGLFEGAELPSDIPAPPTKTDHTWKPGIALTFRVQ